METGLMYVPGSTTGFGTALYKQTNELECTAPVTVTSTSSGFEGGRKRNGTEVATDSNGGTSTNSPTIDVNSLSSSRIRISNEECIYGRNLTDQFRRSNPQGIGDHFSIFIEQHTPKIQIQCFWKCSQQSHTCGGGSGVKSRGKRCDMVVIPGDSRSTKWPIARAEGNLE
eukprot:Lithocolla_globosa_v1_NODE_17_length_10199_cov_15.883281.p3 type:complete len:170 gc:universal NODE_17_length_10199_cov_15.883281:4852-4343(-)